MKKPIIFALPITEWKELVAQLVEQYTFNVWALGSSPSGFTHKSHLFKVAFSILYKIKSRGSSFDFMSKFVA